MNAKEARALTKEKVPQRVEEFLVTAHRHIEGAANLGYSSVVLSIEGQAEETVRLAKERLEQDGYTVVNMHGRSMSQVNVSW